MKNKKITIIFIMIIIILTSSLVTKTFQNDTFFAIAVGNLILDNGIDMMEHLTWHQGLTYCYSHWLFDIILALINNLCGFTGIYIFTIIMANITSITLFKVLTKRKNNELVSFIVTMLTIHLGSSMFTGRAQIISFLLFIIEIYCIEQFLEIPKKRYIAVLFIISIIIANVHAAVWPIYFVMYLPYIAEYILSQMTLEKRHARKKKRALINLQNKNITEKQKSKYEKIIKKAEIFSNKENRKIPYKILIEENKNTNKLIIIMLVSIFTGFITPIGDIPFTYLIKQMQNDIVSSFIQEMQPIIPVADKNFIGLIIIYISIIGFTDTKIKLSDGLFISGFIIMTLFSSRSIYYLIWVCAIPLARIINTFIAKWGNQELDSIKKILQKPKIQTILIIFMCLLSISSYLKLNGRTQYIDKKSYPIQATEYILKNIDINNMRIYNGYNYGSYLEMKGIPVFIDSRADIYCKEFNNTTILEDEKDLHTGAKNYTEIFNKYNITHVLVPENSLIDVYIYEDNNYRKIYSDEYFVLYEKK